MNVIYDSDDDDNDEEVGIGNPNSRLQPKLKFNNESIIYASYVKTTVYKTCNI